MNTGHFFGAFAKFTNNSANGIGRATKSERHTTMTMPTTAPNNRLQATPNSLRSYLASAIGRA
jgi:hypothetical protein